MYGLGLVAWSSNPVVSVGWVLTNGPMSIVHVYVGLMLWGIFVTLLYFPTVVVLNALLNDWHVLFRFVLSLLFDLANDTSDAVQRLGMFLLSCSGEEEFYRLLLISRFYLSVGPFFFLIFCYRFDDIGLIRDAKSSCSDRGYQSMIVRAAVTGFCHVALIQWRLYCSL